MGRPGLSEDEKRTVQVNIRLTANENAKVKNYAEASGLTPANWIRQKAFTGKFPVVKASPIDAALYRELHKVGVNLNQAVRLIHSGQASIIPLSVLEKLISIQQEILKRLLS